ncbi:FtsX-like permease family protein [Amycolatopsis sp. QT-25]|uniref:FtsX-like permease family protein n=1 Tax=Amycolatopsis sp. QT-25 TaxID=3034022 RepID=UPI0023ED3C65|nr:FtsX-like permease family protein [Amycolatopsis sp. QT-25]WET77063.1 FtsX-like permease family protein [Amycolatopsis sp. QT-25]
MLRTVLAGLKARPLRLLLSAVAVTLGVTFVAGSFVLTDSVGAGLRDAAAYETRGVDASITADRAALDDTTLTKARQVPGAAAAEGRTTVSAPLIGPDGRPRDAAATGLSADERLRPYDLVEGRFPRDSGEIALERTSADGFPLGGPVTVLDETGGRHPLTLVGTFSRPADSGLGGANLLVSQEMVHRLNPAATFGEIVVRAAPGVGQARLAADLQKALGVPVVTGKEAAARLLAETAPDTAGLAKFFVGFAVLAMVVAAMVITNSFTVLVTQRARELALLRCVGAGKRQLFGGVLAEAAVVGAVASVAGLFGGVGAAAALQAVAGQQTIHLPLTARTVAAALAVGIGVTSLAAAIPAWAATRVAPVEALRTPAGSTRAGRPRAIVAALLLAVATGAGALALRSSVDGGAALAVPAMAALLGAALAAGPLIAGPVVRTLGRLVPGRAAELGALNADRDPNRTAASAAALTIGLAVVTLATTLAAGVEAGRGRGLDEQLAADFAVTSVIMTRPLPATLVDTLATVPGVTATATRRSFSGDLGEYGDYQLTAVSGDLLRPTVLSGRLGRLGPGEIAISKDLADQTGLAVGGTVRSLRVVGVYDAVDGPGVDVGFALVDVTEQRRLDPAGESYDGSVLVKAADPERTRPALERALSATPLAKLSSAGEIKEEEAAPLRATLNLMWALTGLAVLIAFAGITNTLSLSVLERTRESALLRALGLTRGGLGAALTAEAVFVAVLGAACGLSVGIASAWLITEVAAGGGEPIVFAPPWARLGVLVAAALVAAPLAALVPARRAGRQGLVAGLSAE